eukprot:TRINITY_DN59134_c0_g1_i1.p2 TRINITY_DN59134_c0_g1~~TRINITY_DN59134_c0_g1_i1.p2  ORF type:complete len:134 (-),score=7.34 TRINITY_DN59134_c0_g1_i1:1-402(-)
MAGAWPMRRKLENMPRKFHLWYRNIHLQAGTIVDNSYSKKPTTQVITECKSSDQPLTLALSQNAAVFEDVVHTEAPADNVMESLVPESLQKRAPQSQTTLGSSRTERDSNGMGVADMNDKSTLNDKFRSAVRG